MNSIKIIAVIFFILLNTGCAYINGGKKIVSNRDTDYLSATSVPPLKIPPGLSSDTIQAHYPVPDHDYPANTLKPSLIPPGLY